MRHPRLNLGIISCYKEIILFKSFTFQIAIVVGIISIKDWLDSVMPLHGIKPFVGILHGAVGMTLHLAVVKFHIKHGRKVARFENGMLYEILYLPVDVTKSQEWYAPLTIPQRFASAKLRLNECATQSAPSVDFTMAKSTG